MCKGGNPKTFDLEIKLTFGTSATHVLVLLLSIQNKKLDFFFRGKIDFPC